MDRIRFIALKEIRHILRDSRSLIIAIVMPVMMTFLYGYAVNLDIKNIKLAVIDLDVTAKSRELADRFYNSGYFVHAAVEVALTDPERVLRAGSADAVLIVRPGLEAAFEDRSGYQLGLVVDGANSNLAAAASSYAGIIVGRFIEDLLPPGIDPPGVMVAERVFYNPDLESSQFIVPGLIAIILMMISALLTSITVAREKETGTIEQLLTTPVKPVHVIIGKVIPYIGLALLDGFLVIVFAVIHFGVPLSGSSLLLLFFGLIYVIAALSAGILISTVARTQQVAMMAAQLLTVLPSVMLSGFIFDIRNMPKILQYLSYIVPARYFLRIIRGIMLRGSGLGALWPEALFLTGLTAILLIAASKRFKLQLE
jgi:ABC-2 type transport system permease protein